jgi:hypothetical protein
VRKAAETKESSGRWEVALKAVGITGAAHSGHPLIKDRREGDQHIMSNAGSRFVCTLALVVGVGLTCTIPAVSAPRWVEEGPGPILNGPLTFVPGNNPVSGAINAIAASRTNPDLLYVGTVNGGIWKTINATADMPSWSPLTDRRLSALSINSLEISPLHPRTLFAGTGSTSSFAFDGDPGFGVARSTDGGRTWSVLAQDTFAGRPINSIVPTALDGGNVVLAATWYGPGGGFHFGGGGGVFRSIDMGDTFVRLSGNGTSGLPDQAVSSLVADRGHSNRFYAAVPASPFGATGSEGVYRSDDGGLTWTAVNTGLTGLDTAVRILLSVHNNSLQRTNAVYAALIANVSPPNTLTGVFRSENHGATWTALGVPSPDVFPGVQWPQHGALAADPADPNVVFIAGDRGGTWRGDASLLPGFPWTSVDFSNAHNTSPHPDSRRMVFDTSGDLLQANDGGIYRLVDPNNRLDQRQWVSVNGDIRPTEFHSVAYDPFSGIVFGGTQDNGTPVQSASGEFAWFELLGGDGGNVAVDSDQIAHPGTTIRYTSSQIFGFFNRTTWDATNTMVGGFTPVGLLITSGPGTGETLFQFDGVMGNIQFYQPFVLNTIDPSRMLIGTFSIYESLDRGDTLANLGGPGFIIGNGLGASPMAYGGRLAGRPKPDVFYVGTGGSILHRVALGGPITTLGNYPGTHPLGLVIDPQDYRHVFMLDSDRRVWRSLDEGASWIELTGNLPTLSDSIRVIEFVRPAAQGKPAVLVAGGLSGVFQLRHPQTPGAQWKALSAKLPHGLVLDLHYDANDDVLVAGFLGRGAWTLSGFFGSNVAYAELPQDEDETDVVAEQPRKPTGAAERLMRLLPPAPVAPPPPVAVLPEELTAR